MQTDEIGRLAGGGVAYLPNEPGFKIEYANAVPDS